MFWTSTCSRGRDNPASCQWLRILKINEKGFVLNIVFQKVVLFCFAGYEKVFMQQVFFISLNCFTNVLSRIIIDINISEDQHKLFTWLEFPRRKLIWYWLNDSDSASKNNCKEENYEHYILKHIIWSQKLITSLYFGVIPWNGLPSFHQNKLKLCNRVGNLGFNKTLAKCLTGLLINYFTILLF